MNTNQFNNYYHNSNLNNFNLGYDNSATNLVHNNNSPLGAK